MMSGLLNIFKPKERPVSMEHKESEVKPAKLKPVKLPKAEVRQRGITSLVDPMAQVAPHQSYAVEQDIAMYQQMLRGHSRTTRQMVKEMYEEERRDEAKRKAKEEAEKKLSKVKLGKWGMNG